MAMAEVYARVFELVLQSQSNKSILVNTLVNVKSSGESREKHIILYLCTETDDGHNLRGGGRGKHLT